jgi:two-component system CheB/CheR fusion protein
MRNEAKQKMPELAENFFAVGVGASSGGLEAFQQFVKDLPVNTGMSFILVQHLDPSHNSILPAILQKNTKVPVSEIVDNTKIEPDHIYVIPANKRLAVVDGVLTLTDRSKNFHDNSHLIDLFLTSLADFYQTQAIGIVLSGAGTDGADGLRAIKKNGGVTFVQTPATASYPAMPQHAINEDVVDFELPPEGIVKRLLSFQQTVATKTQNEILIEPDTDEAFFNKILSLLELRKDVDFIYYKHTTIRRRIARRMELKNIVKKEVYYNYLSENVEELDLLYYDLLIPVTEFFRDPKVFDYLQQNTLPAIIKNKGPKEPFRIWSVGCSTGQEPYSLAMLLYEFFELNTERPKIQIFATDISEAAIMRARTGMYSEHDVAGITAERLKKFFSRTESGYLVNKSVRDFCVFAVHNVFANPPFAGIDLVSCRNVLIYMDNVLQRKAMATFHYALNEKGMLLLGRSESSGNSSDLFSTFSEKDKVYLRKLVPGRFIHIATKRRNELLVNDNLKPFKDERPKDDFQKNADDVILAKSPDGVIINDHFEIVHFRGVTGNWIEPSAGKPSLSVLKMVKRELALELRSLIHKAKTTHQPTSKEGIMMQSAGSKKIVTLEVIPLLNTINLYFLILFRNTLDIVDSNSDKSNGHNKEMNASEVRSMQLERELLQTQENMRVIAEDQEAGNEELLSANEELLSGSEELRSLNEELEISKEELQSTVEELSVSNQELAFRVDEVTYSRIYAEAIVSTIVQPLVVLDKELKVKSANTAFYKNFFLTLKETEGKQFLALNSSQWDIPELRSVLERGLADVNFFERIELNIKVSDIVNRVMVLSVKRIYREQSGELFLLLVIEDMTDRRQLEDSLKEKAEFLRGILESSPQISSTASLDGKVNYYNNYFLKFSALTYEEAIDMGWQRVIHPDDLEKTSKIWDHSVATGEEFETEVRFKRHDGIYRWHLSRAIPMRGSDGKISSWVGTAIDIHEQKMFSDELEKKVRRRTASLKQSNFELEHANKNLEQFAFIAAHDLQEPLRKIQIFSGMLTDNFVSQLPADAGELIGKISSSSKRMSTLISDVLNFSQIEKDANAFQATDLSLIFQDVLGDFSLLIEEKQANIQLGRLPTAEVIPFQLHQLFYNLISNSLKFSRHEGHPQINITSRELSPFQIEKYPGLNKGRAYFEILFEDNGIGFDQKYSEQIFSIFQRLHRSDLYGGTGIGLALCKRIVSYHNGEISAESKEGSGALFRIILPFKRENFKEVLLSGYVE